MTDDTIFSSVLPDDDSLDQALAEIERAMLRFEKILAHHGQALGTAATRRKSTKKLLISSLSGILGDFMRHDRRNDRVSPPIVAETNRFPASGGQILADLAASLRQNSGRNL